MLLLILDLKSVVKDKCMYVDFFARPTDESIDECKPISSCASSSAAIGAILKRMRTNVEVLSLLCLGSIQTWTVQLKVLRIWVKAINFDFGELL